MATDHNLEKSYDASNATVMIVKARHSKGFSSPSNNMRLNMDRLHEIKMNQRKNTEADI